MRWVRLGYLEDRMVAKSNLDLAFCGGKGFL